VSVTRGKEPKKKVTWGEKKRPFHAKKLVTDLSTKLFQQVSKWVHTVNTISGSSAKTEAESDTEGAISEAESEASTPKPKKPKEAQASSQDTSEAEDGGDFGFDQVYGEGEEVEQRGSPTETAGRRHGQGPRLRSERQHHWRSYGGRWQ